MTHPLRQPAATLAAVAIFCALAPAACGGGDTAPPVASVSATLNKSRASIGAPVDFTYRFEALPGASIEGDYRVFVQIKDADGQIVWSDDHEPAVPTSTWKPGQVVEYTRTSFVPARVATGDVTVFAGLYNDDRRLPLKAADPSGREPADRSYRVATLQIAPESERIFLIFKSGWYAEEAPTNDTDPWKWTQQSAVLAFENPKADVTLFLDYDARPDVFSDGPQSVALALGDQPLQTLTADTQERRLVRIPINAAMLGTGPMAEVRIDVDKAFVPSSLPAGSRDNRRLGIRVYHVFVDRR